MIEVYCKLIIEGRRKFDDVPSKLKAGVKARLKELGYNTEGGEI